MIITINISEEQIRRAEALAKHRRMTTGESASRSSEIGRAIDALFLSECPTNSTVVHSADRPVEPVAK